jgi:hypothetical protein
MSKIMFDYTKSILERVSFDPILFVRVRKAIRILLPYELEQLREWLFDFIIETKTMLIDSRAIKVRGISFGSF